MQYVVVVYKIKTLWDNFTILRMVKNDPMYTYKICRSFDKMLKVVFCVKNTLDFCVNFPLNANFHSCEHDNFLLCDNDKRKGTMFQIFREKTNTKNIKVSASKWKSHKECRHNAIINNFVA